MTRWHVPTHVPTPQRRSTAPTRAAKRRLSSWWQAIARHRCYRRSGASSVTRHTYSVFVGYDVVWTGSRLRSTDRFAVRSGEELVGSPYETDAGEVVECLCGRRCR